MTNKINFLPKKFTYYSWNIELFTQDRYSSCMIEMAVQRAFEQKLSRGWDRLYWAIDLHDVLIVGKYNRLNEGKEFCDGAIEILKWLMSRSDMKTILWSSSHDDSLKDFVDWAKSEHAVEFDYVNENPECSTNELCDFAKKFYFNVLIDDKAGFDYKSDWLKIKQVLIEIGEWEEWRWK